MASKNTFTSKSPDDTTRFAKGFVENLLKTTGKTGGKPVQNATVVALQGDLGAGKTTFVKAVAEAFGIQKTVTSPTFVLEKVYKINGFGGFTQLIHIDAYRLENGAELLTLGWRALIEDPQNIIFIEWPERVAEVLMGGVQTIQFIFIDEMTRKITF
jgi:tRNA threonylcarbamoyladenosine biosynthesis protein TsaE